jgi:2-amino-4-hydroxy-6-hydroxymethyldihydropteridine diphosphokinase
VARVYLGVGSNIERERSIVAGLDALLAGFGELTVSSVYDSAAIGFDGQPFLNLVVALDTDVPLGKLARDLRHIEMEHGRPVNASRFSSRQLDIDILTYANQVGTLDGVQLPRGEILQNAFVLCPLAELAPAELHPQAGKTYDDLWHAFDQRSQPLHKVDFQWRGRSISSSHH